MSQLELNCLVHGDGPGQVFTVKIAGTENVSMLREAIKEEKSPLFDAIPAHHLALWKVSISADTDELLEEELKHLVLEDKLSPRKRLATIFSDIDAEALLNFTLLYVLPPSLLELHCLVLGDGNNNIFSVKIAKTEFVGALKEVVKEEKSPSFNDIPADSLALWKVSFPVDENSQASLAARKFVDNESLPAIERLSDIFSDVPVDRNLHIVVKCLVTLHSLHSVQEEDSRSGELSKARRALHWCDSARDTVVEAARERVSPSTGATSSVLIDTQNPQRPDAVYNYRPMSLAPPPISIYHPIFVKFINLMAIPTKGMEFTHEELDLAFRFVDVSLALYTSESARHETIQSPRVICQSFWQGITVYTGAGRHVIPDGIVKAQCPNLPQKPMAATSVNELKNGNGEGGCDALKQAECDYIAICASPSYQHLHAVSCCPTFLVGLEGPNLAVSGSVFADNFLSERLTDYIFMGPRLAAGTQRSSLDGAIREVAKLFRSLKTCLDELEIYYQNLKLPPAHITPSRTKSNQRNSRTSRLKQLPLPQIFPFWNSFRVDNESYTLTYTERLAYGDPEKAVFKASMQKLNGTENEIVVVKFAPTYGRKGHELLASLSPPLAPKLWYCEEVEEIGIPTSIDALNTALQTLHSADLVFGDLRQPNVIQIKNSKDPSKDGVMLVDFDWCNTEGEARYPSDINLDPDMGWHNEVCRGGKIKKAHDEHLLRQWTSL